MISLLKMLMGQFLCISMIGLTTANIIYTNSVAICVACTISILISSAIIYCYRCWNSRWMKMRKKVYCWKSCWFFCISLIKLTTTHIVYTNSVAICVGCTISILISSAICYHYWCWNINWIKMKKVYNRKFFNSYAYQW